MRRIIILMLIMVMTVTGCIQSKSADIMNEEESVIRLEGSDTGLPNPFRHHTRGPGMSKMQLLYDSLLEMDENGFIPWLASEYIIDASGLVYTFKLVENAKWHDGESLTADDLIFTFNYYKEHTPVTDNLNINGEYIIESLEKISDYEVKITVTSKDVTILERLGGTRILPKHIWSHIVDPNNYQGEDAVVASGPYKMVHYDSVKGEYRYEAYEDYWGYKPAVEAIEWIPVSDSVLAFENGEINLVNVSADIVERYKNQEEYSVQTLPSFHSYRLMMNMEKVEDIQSIELRQAMAYGINREDLVEKIARGAATVASMGYVPTTSSWYNKTIEQYDYNPDKSLELLGESTYSFKMLTGNTDQEIKIAELIRLDFEKIGIEINIESVESKTRDEAVKSGEYELLLINSGGMGSDPDYLRNIYASSHSNQKALHSAGVRGYSNNRLNQLAKEQAVELDVDKREELIDEMQMIIAKEVPMIMLYSTLDNFVYRQGVYDGWMARFNHSKLDHNKLSYVIRENND